jgi:hypothetical protein
MSCSECGCRKQLEKPVLILRITHAGKTTIESLNEFLSVAEHLGAPGDTKLQVTDGSTFLDIPGELFTTKLEIDNIRKMARTQD